MQNKIYIKHWHVFFALKEKNIGVFADSWADWIEPQYAHITQHEVSRLIQVAHTHRANQGDFYKNTIQEILNGQDTGMYFPAP